MAGTTPIIRLGISGLGLAGTTMIRGLEGAPGVAIAGAAEPVPAPRAAFARDFDAPAYDDIAALCADPGVDTVYIATPHQFHAEQAITAAEHGKHVIVEKPLALTLADCDRIIAAVERAGVTLIVGHTHAFDPAVREMRRIIAARELGPLAMIAAWNYTDYLYRPRRPEELDTASGGGILFNQVPHQIDVARLLGGGMVRGVRAVAGSLDPARPTEGHCAALLTFENGASASLVYGGYGFFDSDELHGWIGERGKEKPAGGHGAARRALRRPGLDERAERTARYAYRDGETADATPRHQPHFGLLAVTCERGEMRPSADGVTIYEEAGAREILLPRGPGMPGRREVIEELRGAIFDGIPPVHDARWGKAGLEVALAMLTSSREGREVQLSYQVPVPTGR